MAYWKDNADSYLCSACGYECDNPNKLPDGPGECPRCHAKMTVSKQHKPGGDAAPLGYCPFSKHPCGSACALFNANLRRCGILAALEMR